MNYSDLITPIRKYVCADNYNVAIISGSHSVTYSELYSQSIKIAKFLRESGVNSGDKVALCCNKTAETIAAILGIIFVGAVYVPIGTGLASERIKYILENCESKLYLDDIQIKKALSAKVNDEQEQYICNVHPEQTAYIIYTSGTTGKPKGVEITHQAVINTIEDINNRFSIKEDVIVNLSAFTFDLSIYDIFGSLCTGSKLVLIDENRNPELIYNAINKNKVTFWNSVPAIMELFLEWVQDKYIFDSVLNILLRGDYIPINIIEKIRCVFPNAQIYSLGGATEASIWSIYYKIEQINPDWNTIPYGYPLTNQQIFIMDDSGNLCPIGVQGEICIGGLGVAKSYISDSQKTKQSFVMNTSFGRLYKTGDYGKMTKAGYVEFLGRKDNQIKLRGFRIELAEIENTIEQLSFIGRAVVKMIETNGINNIVAFVTFKNGIFKQNAELLILEESQKFLPEYMIPSKIIFLENIPQTSNGKVDNKALISMVQETKIQSKVSDNNIARTETEKKLMSICKSLFNNKNIGYDQNFFEMGGDSILLIRFLTMIENEFSYKIPITEFIDNPKISRLAKYLDSFSKNCKNLNHLKHIKEGNENKILFVHDGFGQLEVYLNLCKELNSKSDIWGVELHHNHIYPINYSVVDLTSQYVDEIKSIVEGNSLTVVGWSMGGTLAYEISRVLEKDKYNVKLIMLDSFAPGYIDDTGKITVNSEKKLAREIFNNTIDFDKCTDIPEIWQVIQSSLNIPENQEKIYNFIMNKLYDVNISDQMPILEICRFVNIMRSLIGARNTYLPDSSFSGQVHYVVPSKTKITNYKKWNNYMNTKMIIHEIEGSYLEILKDKSDEIAQLIEKIEIGVN